LYQDGDLKTKRRIISSIFPEKLVFNGNNYRTARVNEAVELIYNVGHGFSENKNGQTDKNFDLSTQVNRIGQKSNHFIEDLKLSIALSD
jgi:site-specific DNA recombinase